MARILLVKGDLARIEELAFLLFTPKLISLSMGLDELDFLEEFETPGSDIRAAYYAGYSRQLELARNAISKSAKDGDADAQKLLVNLISSVNNEL